MEMIEGGQGARAPRVTNACEACRLSKVKCQASSQLGICKRCLGSRRECIFKTGPRTRRPRLPKLPDAGTTAPSSSTAAAPLRPPPPGPSKTFTIDIPMPAADDDDDIADSLEALRLAHEQAIDGLVPHLTEDDDEDDDGYGYDHDQAASRLGTGSAFSQAASSLPLDATMSTLATPPASSSSSVVVALSNSGAHGGEPDAAAATAKPKPKPRTLASLRLQPQFNLDSAGRLLATFRDVMLGHFHCVVIAEDDTVAGMAAARPFVLLAVLAAASGSRAMQGHSLYDDEFRKILGLKFVAGGERSLELLQGLVIYIAWYPFHLRPKNKQALHYVRMVVDIVDDLELDQDPGTDSMDVAPTPERLEQVRLYLASYYLASAFASTWNRTPALTYTDYTARCCDLLQQHSRLQGDHVLAWQARLQRLVEATNDLRRAQRGGHSHSSDYQMGLMLRGMETQLAEWQQQQQQQQAENPSLRIAALFTRVFLWGAPLLRFPAASARDASSAAFRADPDRLRRHAVPRLHDMFEYILSLAPDEVNALSGVEWGALVLSVVLGFRMSFPLADCPEWDDGAARDMIRFGEYMERLCRMGGKAGGEEDEDGGETERAGLPPEANRIPPTFSSCSSSSSPSSAQAGGQGRRSMDLLSAMTICLGVVRRKYLKRVAKLEKTLRREQQGLDAAVAASPPPAPPPHRAGTVHHDPTVSGCPMMDGSLEPYYPYWDETFTNHLAASAFAAAEAPGGGDGDVDADVNPVGLVLPNDLWEAMTIDWAAQAGLDFHSL